MTEALIIDACRTPRGIGKQGKGALADMHPQHLAASVLKALAERNNLKTAEVDDIIWGTSTQKGAQGNDMGRMAALDAGYDVLASGMTLDRFCGSGITTVNLATASIMAGMEDLVPDGGTTWMLARQVGKARATEMMMLGERIPAEKAEAWGLIHAAVDDAELMARATALAERLAAGPTRAYSLMRQGLVRAMSQSYEEALNTEATHQALCADSADAKEGGMAFLERRKAAFKGA